MAVSSDKMRHLCLAIQEKLSGGDISLQDLAVDVELNNIVVGADTGGESIISSFCVQRIGKEWHRLPGSNIVLALSSQTSQFQGTMAY